MNQSVIDKNQDHIPECPCYSCCPGKANFAYRLGDVLIEIEKDHGIFGRKLQVIALYLRPRTYQKRILFVSTEEHSGAKLFEFIERRSDDIFCEKHVKLICRYSNSKNWNGVDEKTLLRYYKTV